MSKKIRKPKKRKYTKRAKPISGQSAPQRDLPVTKLNPHERRVVKALDQYKRPPFTVAAIAKASRLTMLQVRNALRRLVCGTWVERVEDGVYMLTEPGLKRLKRANPKKASRAPKPVPVEPTTCGYKSCDEPEHQVAQ